MDSYRLEVYNKFSNNDLVEILEEYSFDAVNNFEDNFFDWTYLDANHSYSHVFQDLQIWWKKLKSKVTFAEMPM